MNDHRRACLLLHLAREGVPRPQGHGDSRFLLTASAAELAARIGQPLADRVCTLRRQGEPDREFERTCQLGARIVMPDDADFPRDLREHPSCPALLYVKGNLAAPPPRAAIVGARRATPVMMDFARALGRACATAGIPVVSGLALGIDAAAHEGSLAANGTPLGVLGTGIDVVYPPSSKRLHAAVAERGALLSTYPLGAAPLRYRFPLRNQLVAALSAVVCVVQATVDSGSMTTAAAALEANTEVMAIPGSITDPLFAGTNRLIRDGARPVLEPADLVEALLGQVGSSTTDAPPAPAETSAHPLLQRLRERPRAPEELAAVTGHRLEEVVAELLDLELRGIIEKLPGRLFRVRGW